MAQINVENRMALLAGHPVFAKLSAEQRRAIATVMGEHRYKAGETVFLAGDPADRLYIIISGTVRINILSEDGREMLLNVMRQNDIFGEIALIDSSTRTASAVALTDCHFLSLARAPFLELLAGNGALAAGIFAVLVERLRHMSELLQNLALRPVGARVAFALLVLADRHGHKTEDGTLIDLKISQTDIGALAHASRPTVNDELKHLERDGYIARQVRKIVIRDRAGLNRVVHTAPPMELKF